MDMSWIISGDTRWAVWRTERSPKTTGAASQLLVRTVNLSPELKTGDITPGAGTTVVRADEVPPVGRMVMVQPEFPPDSVSMSPDSPQTVSFDDSAASSVPLSPNQVWVDVSQDIPVEGTVFDVSPDNSRSFLMRPSGVSVQTPVGNCPFPLAVNPFSDPVLGDLIALCAMIPGSDTPMTLPVYTMPSGLSLMPGQSGVETIRASAESSHVEGWSAGTPWTDEVSREGPFDAYASPMDTGDSPLVATGLAGLSISDYLIHGPGSR